MFSSLDCFSGEKCGDIECRLILCKNERKFDGFMFKSLGGLLQKRRRSPRFLGQESTSMISFVMLFVPKVVLKILFRSDC